LYCIVLYCIVLYCIVLFCFVLLSVVHGHVLYVFALGCRLEIKRASQ
jgi:DNA-directed RNA polymerase subunit E'/Rpb7